MADKVTRIDDLEEDGQTVAVERLHFSVRGEEYEIDLSEENVKRFDEVLQPYISHARRVEAHPSTPTRSRTIRPIKVGNRGDIPLIRKWAVEKGYNVNERGRIKRELIDEYDREQGRKSSL